MNSKPLISIIMTVYNNEKYFPIAVNHIIEQSFKNWELIIVDDGSQDQTGIIADNYSMMDSRIKVIHQNNLWVYAALNNGIQKAEGEYIFVHNSDDIIVSDALSIMAEKIYSYSPDVIWIPVIYHRCDENQNIIEYDFANVENLIEKEFVCKNKKEVENNWLYFWKKCLSDNQVNCYKAELMKNHLFHTDMFCADAIFNTEIADKIHTAVVLKEPLYICYRYLDDKMNASFGKWYENEHEMYNKMYYGFINLFEKWNRPEEEYKDYWNNWRINCFISEMNRFTDFNKTYGNNEKLYKILNVYVDDLLLNCAKELKKEQILEKIIISKCKKIWDMEEVKTYEEMYFVRYLIDALEQYNVYGFADLDSKYIEDKNNPKKIGRMLLIK